MTQMRERLTGNSGPPRAPERDSASSQELSRRFGPRSRRDHDFGRRVIVARPVNSSRSSVRGCRQTRCGGDAGMPTLTRIGAFTTSTPPTTKVPRLGLRAPGRHHSHRPTLRHTLRTAGSRLRRRTPPRRAAAIPRSTSRADRAEDSARLPARRARKRAACRRAPYDQRLLSDERRPLEPPRARAIAPGDSPSSVTVALHPHSDSDLALSIASCSCTGGRRFRGTVDEPRAVEALGPAYRLPMWTVRHYTRTRGAMPALDARSRA